MYCIVVNKGTKKKRYVYYDNRYKLADNKKEVVEHVKDHTCVHPYLFAKKDDALALVKKFEQQLPEKFEIEQFI